MGDLFLFSLSVAIFLLAGFTVLRLVDPQGELGFGLISRVAVWFLAGLGAVSLQMFLYSLAGIRFAPISIALPWVVSGAFLAKRSCRGRSTCKGFRTVFSGLDILSGIFLLIICAQLVYAFMYASILPVSGWDAWAIWFLKAKVFFIEKGVASGFLLDPSFGYSHADYPLSVPLSVAWVYTVLGSADDSLARLLYPLQMVSLLAVFHHFARSVSGIRTAYLFTALLSLTPILVIHGAGLPLSVGGLYTGDYVGYADLALSACFMASGALIYLYLRDGRPSQLLLAVLFLSIGAWTKNEGLTFALAGLVILLLKSFMFERKGLFIIIASVGVLAVFIAPWALYKASLGIGSEYSGRAAYALSSEGMSRLPVIFRHLAQGLFALTGLFSFAWWLWLAGSVLNIKGRLKMPLLSLNVLALAQLGVYVFVYMITPADLEWHLKTSLDRLLLQLLPLFMLISAIDLCAVLKSAAPDVPDADA